MSRVKLVKVDQTTREHINYGAVERTDTVYQVQVDGRPIGYVSGIWNVEHLGTRSSVERSWSATHLDGRPTRPHGMNWFSSQKRAVDHLVRGDFD